MPIPTAVAARVFAENWIAAWNAHDIDAVLIDFSDDFEFLSPFISQVVDEISGKLAGKAAVRAYWTTALARLPNLHFELVDVLSGVDSLCVLYRGHRGLSAEVFEFDTDGQVVRARALYIK